MTFGTAGIVMTQIDATRRYACLFGLAGQAGWAGGLHFVPAQIGMCVVSVICCAAWMWGFWKHWMRSWLVTDMTLSAGRGGGGSEPPKPRPKARLRLVK